MSGSQSETYRVCYVPREGDSDFDSVGESQNVYDVIVNGHELKALLDTEFSVIVETMFCK